MRKWLVSVVSLFITLYSISALASTPDDNENVASESPAPVGPAILIGHNVTPTTDIPAAGTWTAGTYAVGLSVSKHFFVVTSPWIWASYNTANFHVKYATDITDRLQLGVFLSYFESYASTPFISEVGGSSAGTRPSPTTPPAPRQGGGGGGHFKPINSAATTTTVYEGTNRYQWKSQSVHFGAAYKIDHDITLYGNLHYGYFWDDEFPYSIRMDPGRDSIRGQVDATTLTQFRLWGSHFHYMFEIGALGLNYVAPYFQLGSSIAYLNAGWLIQLGASATMPFGEVGYESGWTPGRYDSRQHTASNGDIYYSRYLQTAVHPEIQLQYFF